MSVVQIAPPKMLCGDVKSQLLDINTYLFKLSEQLNVNLSNITPVKFWEATSRAVASNGKSKEDKALLSSYNAIKSLIIKTAEDVVTTSESFKIKLGSEYIAKSRFGEYFENATVDIEGTPIGITQLYSYSAGIKSEFADFSVGNRTYIKTGLLYYDESTPVYGVGVGILESTTDIGDRLVLDKTNLLATYTAEEIAFWSDNTKLAYITPASVYFPSAVITGGSIDINNKFIVTNIGDFKARSGVIGSDTLGWHIDSNSIYSGNDFANAEVFVCTGSIGQQAVAGHTGTGWYLKAGNATTGFGVNKQGQMYVNSGKIGNWDITDSGVSKEKITYHVEGIRSEERIQMLSNGTFLTQALLYFNNRLEAEQSIRLVGGTMAVTDIDEAADHPRPTSIMTYNCRGTQYRIYLDTNTMTLKGEIIT